MLGWQFQVSSADISVSQVGFLGIAVALLGRNTAIGTVFAALLFGALETGTSAGNINSTSLNPELAPQLTYVIEGLIVLLVSTDLIAVRLLGLPRRLGCGGPGAGADLAQELEPDDPALDAAEALQTGAGDMSTATLRHTPGAGSASASPRDDQARRHRGAPCSAGSPGS